MTKDDFIASLEPETRKAFSDEASVSVIPNVTAALMIAHSQAVSIRKQSELLALNTSVTQTLNDTLQHGVIPQLQAVMTYGVKGV